MCTFLAISRKVENRIGLGVAVVVVQAVTCAAHAVIYHGLLKPGALAWAGLSAIDLGFLGLITYIGVIAPSCSVLEMFLDRYAPALYHGARHLPAADHRQLPILAGSLFMVERDYSVSESIVLRRRQRARLGARLVVLQRSASG